MIYVYIYIYIQINTKHLIEDQPKPSDKCADLIIGLSNALRDWCELRCNWWFPVAPERLRFVNTRPRYIESLRGCHRITMSVGVCISHPELV